MAVELKSIARDVLVAFERLDADRALRHVAADVQAVDQISRRWLRGREVAELFRQLQGVVSPGRGNPRTGVPVSAIVERRAAS